MVDHHILYPPWQRAVRQEEYGSQMENNLLRRLDPEAVKQLGYLQVYCTNRRYHTTPVCLDQLVMLPLRG